MDTEKLCERTEDWGVSILGKVGKAALVPKSESDPSLTSQQFAVDRVESMDTDNLSKIKEKTDIKGWLLSKIAGAGGGGSCVHPDVSLRGSLPVLQQQVACCPDPSVPRVWGRFWDEASEVQQAF